VELIIEILGRGSHAFDLQKIEGDTIRIGRAFDNDLILSDPHICPHHAVLELDEQGGIVLRDTGSINGTFAKGHKPIESEQKVTSGDEFSLGKSRFRVYLPDHPVADSIRLNWVERLAHTVNLPLVAGGLSLVLLVLHLYLQYAGEISEFYVGREVLGAVGVLMVISLWPTSWTLFARYKKHEARFLAQLSATVLFVIVFTLLDKLKDWLAFHNGSSVLIDGVVIVLSIGLTLLLIWFHFYLSIFQASRKRWFYAGGMTALFVCIAYIGSNLDKDSFSSRPEYVAKIYPSSVSFYSTQTTDEFIKAAESIFEDSKEEAGHKDVD